MKNLSFQLIIVFVLMTFFGFSQNPTIELTFTAKHQLQHVSLDSIYIENLTQSGDTMLFAPDTVLLLDYVSGLPDDVGAIASSFSASPKYPNPSVDGKTSSEVFIPEKEIINIRIF